MALRVAVVHSFYSSQQPSGENAQVEAEVAALARAGAQVRLFATRTDEAEGQTFYRLRAAARVATGRGSSPLEAIEAWNPSVVHVHNLFPNIGRTWARELSVPLVVTLHNFRFTCANGVLVRSGRQCTDCPDGQRLAALRHRCYRSSFSATAPLVIAQARGAGNDPVLMTASRVLCLSERQRRMLVGLGLPSDSLVDWTNFLPDRFDPVQFQRSPQAEPSGAICVGRLTAEKGVVELATTWQGPGVLEIVGGGPLLDELRRVGASRPVRVLGPRTRAEVIELMARRTALVFPGETPELAPLSYMEALAGRVPVVVRRKSDLAPRVQADKVGLVVDEPREIGTAVDALAKDRPIRDRCRAVYEQRYTEDAWVRRMLDLYSTVCEQRPVATGR